MTDPWEAQREALGAFIREQRKRANVLNPPQAEQHAHRNTHQGYAGQVGAGDGFGDVGPQ